MEMHRYLPLLLIAACAAEDPTPAAQVADGQQSDIFASDISEIINDIQVADTNQPADTQPNDAVPDAAQVSDTVADSGPADAEDTLGGVAADAVDAAADATPPWDVGFAPAPDAQALPSGATNTDLIGVDWTCKPPWQTKPCLIPTLLDPALQDADHVDLPTPITYVDTPPSSGTHRPAWAKFGEYAFLPKQRWLHNAEHGAVILLYHPCAPKQTVEALRAFAKTQVAQQGDFAFRQLMTPYPALQSTIAMVTWGHVYFAECVQPELMQQWLLAHYNKAAEDMPYSGSYDELWLAPLSL